jgi:hypothetical protein
MTRVEVESILGTPGDHTTGPTTIDSRVLMFGWFGSPPQAADAVDWQADDVCISVAFDASGRQVGSVCGGNHRIEQSLFDNLLWRAKRQWRRWFPE